MAQASGERSCHTQRQQTCVTVNTNEVTCRGGGSPPEAWGEDKQLQGTNGSCHGHSSFLLSSLPPLSSLLPFSLESTNDKEINVWEETWWGHSFLGSWNRILRTSKLASILKPSLDVCIPPRKTSGRGDFVLNYPHEWGPLSFMWKLLLLGNTLISSSSKYLQSLECVPGSVPGTGKTEVTPAFQLLPASWLLWGHLFCPALPLFPLLWRGFLLGRRLPVFLPRNAPQTSGVVWLMCLSGLPFWKLCCIKAAQKLINAFGSRVLLRTHRSWRPPGPSFPFLLLSLTSPITSLCGAVWDKCSESNTCPCKTVLLH